MVIRGALASPGGTEAIRMVEAMGSGLMNGRGIDWELYHCHPLVIWSRVVEEPFA